MPSALRTPSASLISSQAARTAVVRRNQRTEVKTMVTHLRDALAVLLRASRPDEERMARHRDAVYRRFLRLPLG
ncbi:hypothetical protein [Sinomonas halotolerans]|uniref:Uncharacterized protein n=1 Tax=Sinomonas halotolerans TaxID=1644133 RepID=A0ABU9X241_9MICC